MRSRRVSLTQPYLPAYRRALFQRVADDLRVESVELRVFHLDAGPDLRDRGEAVEAEWAHVVPGFARRSPAGLVTLRRLPDGWSRPDLLLTELAAGNLNAWGAAAGRQPFVLLGHGSSDSTGSSALGQWSENRLIRRAEHTLTYLPRGARDVLAATGLPETAVSSFGNSTDSAPLRARRDAVHPGELAAFAAANGLRVGVPTILFVGRLDTVKRLDLLVDAVRESRRRLPDLQVILGGRGPDEDRVRELSGEPGVAWLGRMGRDELALASHLGHVLLNPGRIGLVAVDALALNLFVITAAGASHAPEVEYLRPGVELREVAGDAATLGQAVVDAVAAGRPPMRAAGDYPTAEGAAETMAARLIEVLRRGTAGQPNR